MEFQNLGEHCSYSYCKQKDFLPFTCDGCMKVFCAEHRTYRAHECEKPAGDGVQVIICPMCSTSIKINDDDNADEVFTVHEKTNCDPSKTQKEAKEKCIQCKKTLTSINKMSCTKCFSNVCIKHRGEADHNCQGRPKSKLLTEVYKNNKSIKPQESKTEETKLNIPVWTESRLAELKLVESVPVIEEKCPICDKRFDDINKLIEHSETHYEPPKTTITETAQCPICQKYFGIPELIKHCNQDHIL